MGDRAAPTDDLLAWHERLAEALAQATDTRSALASLCEVVRLHVPCDRVEVWRGDVRQMSMFNLIAAGYPDGDAERVARLVVPMVGLPLAPEFLERKYLTLAEVSGAGRFATIPFDDFGIRAAAYVLLERGGRVLGAMQLSWCDVGRPDFPSAAVCALIGRYGGLAVDIHARSEEALQTASTLSATAMLLAHIHDPDALLEAMAGRIAHAVGCDWGSVHLPDERAGVLRYAAGAGPEALLERFRPIEIPLTTVEALIARAAEGVIEVADASQHTPTKRHLGEGTPGVSSYLTLALRRDRRLVGLLTLGYTERKGRFARRQVTLAKGLAYHAVAALENARLVRSLRDASQTKSDFVAAVSHDLRTPLHIMIGYTDMLLGSAAGPLAPEQAELVTRVHDCSVRFLRLVDGILDVARLDAGQERPTAVPVDLATLRDALNAEVEALRRPGVALEWDLALDSVRTDSAKVQTILRNLVTNALKFTNAGQVTVHCAGTPEGGLVLRVTDTGPGVDPADRDRIFDMFEQGDVGRRAGGSGLGLGLYLVKRLAAVLGGTVALVSGEPGDTTFEVRLPPPE
jgi:signal transduction histidine kinase